MMCSFKSCQIRGEAYREISFPPVTNAGHRLGILERYCYFYLTSSFIREDQRTRTTSGLVTASEYKIIL